MKKYFLAIFILSMHTMHAQNIYTIAGTGSSSFSGNGVPAISAGMPNPGGGVFDKFGNYFFSDAENSNRIRKIDVAGVITTAAGNGNAGFAGDMGPATSAKLNDQQDVGLDSFGNIYIADLQNDRIRKVDISTGIITTIVGNGTGSYNGDSIPATSAEIWGPESLCLDKFNNLYIADAFNYRVRMVTPEGTIYTIAGNGLPGYSGEGTRADTSMIGLIVGLCADTAGNIYLASNTVNRVLKVNRSGIVTTVAGNGSPTYSGDGGPATSASISPLKVAVDSLDNLFIADKYNNRVYKVDNSGILHNVAGDGAAGDSGDGSAATAASLYGPSGVALDACGNLYIPTVGGTMSGTGRRIREVVFDTACSLLSLNVKETKSNRPIILYPNPVYDNLAITSDNNIAEIAIMNLAGQTVLQSVCNTQKAEINITSLPPGLYLVAIFDEEGNKTIKKVLKQ